MFEAIRVYKNERLNREEFLTSLYNYGYERVGRTGGIGDFDSKGEVISIFPVTFNDPIRLELKDEAIERIRSYDIETGHSLEEHNIAIILPIKGIYKKKIKSQLAAFSERSPIDSFVDIEPDDKVVHVDHGIGIYKGIERHKVKGGVADHIVIEYADDDKLHIPFEDLNLIQNSM